MAEHSGGLLGCSLGGQKFSVGLWLETKVWVICVPLGKAQGRAGPVHLGCWQNSHLQAYGTRVQVSLLANSHLYSATWRASLVYNAPLSQNRSQNINSADGSKLWTTFVRFSTLTTSDNKTGVSQTAQNHLLPWDLWPIPIYKVFRKEKIIHFYSHPKALHLWFISFSKVSPPKCWDPQCWDQVLKTLSQEQFM